MLKLQLATGQAVSEPAMGTLYGWGHLIRLQVPGREGGAAAGDAGGSAAAMS